MPGVGALLDNPRAERPEFCYPVPSEHAGIALSSGSQPRPGSMPANAHGCVVAVGWLGARPGARGKQVGKAANCEASGGHSLHAIAVA